LALTDRAMFADRRTAGRQLAARLHHLRQDEPLVLALPRGGVSVGFEVAQELGAPLDIQLVRKIGVPGSPNWRSARSWTAPTPRC
jgi:putative phosphoribosyl transferase